VRGPWFCRENGDGRGSFKTCRDGDSALASRGRAGRRLVFVFFFSREGASLLWGFGRRKIKEDGDERGGRLREMVFFLGLGLSLFVFPP